jgi:flavin reductase
MLTTPIATHARARFIGAMGSVATGVSIVTTDGLAGRFALTVSAFSSVSADPPMILACINRRSPLADAVRENAVFCVNVLGADQSALADRFAGRPRDGAAYAFDCAAWDRLETGAPRLVNAVASFDCRLDRALDQGTHVVLFGRVLAVADSATHALVYARRTYAKPQHLAPEHASRSHVNSEVAL